MMPAWTGPDGDLVDLVALDAEEVGDVRRRRAARRKRIGLSHG